MKKILTIFIFIFLTGLFTGLFFSINMSEENTASLSTLLLKSLISPCKISVVFFSALISNIILIAVMATAILCKYLCPLPPALLLFKGFTTGFCCGLLYMSAADNPFLFSIVKLFPQNIFFVPAFIVAAAAVFYSSVKGMDALGSIQTKSHAWGPLRSGSGARRAPRKSRLPFSGSLLLYILIIALFLIITGSFMEALLHQAALSP